MSKCLIDFDTLKFNLYEILNVSQDASIYKIKKAYKKLNNNENNDIYNHIIIAKKILTKKKYRNEYDNFLNNLSRKDIIYQELKTTSDNILKDTKEDIPNLIKNINNKSNFNLHFEEEKKNNLKNLISIYESQNIIFENNYYTNFDDAFKILKVDFCDYLNFKDNTIFINDENTSYYENYKNVIASDYSSLHIAFKLDESTCSNYNYI